LSAEAGHVFGTAAGSVFRTGTPPGGTVVMSKVTIEDISRATGLSRGTVSRALNDRPDISDQTKRRVLEACTELKYVPSHAARSLATGRRYAAAVVVDDLSAPFATRFLRGVIARARAERYAVHVLEFEHEREAALEHLRTAVSERVDCVLLAAALPTEFATRLTEIMGERPLVAAANVPDLACDALLPDWVEAGRLAARHIVRGNQNDTLFVYRARCTTAAEQRQGFQEVCRSMGADADGMTLEIDTESGGSAFDALRARIGGLRAVAASDDSLALEALLAASQAGRTPGRDVAILGAGNESFGARIAPALSTIDLGGEEIGQRAIELALQRVAKTRQDSAQRTFVPPTLIARESTRSVQ
jgi:LacI family transcriptional regulator